VFSGHSLQEPHEGPCFLEKGFVEFNRDLYAVNPLQIILQGWVDYIWTDEITVSAPFGRVDLEAAGGCR